MVIKKTGSPKKHPRQKVGKHYHSYDKYGKLKKSVSIKRSLAMDRVNKSSVKFKNAGWGHQGDNIKKVK